MVDIDEEMVKGLSLLLSRSPTFSPSYVLSTTLSLFLSLYLSLSYSLSGREEFGKGARRRGQISWREGVGHTSASVPSTHSPQVAAEVLTGSCRACCIFSLGSLC